MLGCHQTKCEPDGPAYKNGHAKGDPCDRAWAEATLDRRASAVVLQGEVSVRTTEAEDGA